MQITVDPQTARRARLLELSNECQDVYDDDAKTALESGNPVPRYALMTSEGSPESSYRDNPNLTVHDTTEAMGTAAANEYDEGWCALKMIDLDTGAELGWSIKVVVG